MTLTINSASDTGSGLHATETYSFDGGTTWQTSNKKTYTENTSGIVIKVKDKVGNIYTHSTINITYIDKGAPSKPTAISITPTLNTITVKASGSSDSGSGLAGYKYKLGENGTWSSTIASDTNHVFENIKSNTTVNVYAKAVDKLGWESSEYGPVNGKTSAVTNKVVITLSTDSWTKGPITATLSYDNIPTGYTMQYKIGTGNWTSGTKTSDISSNTTIYGRLYNSTAEDEIANNSKSVSNIDNEPPTDPTGLQVVTRNRTSIVVKASGSTDSGSGLAGYQYSINGTNWSATIASGTNHTINSLTENTQYTVYVRAIDKLQNISTNNYPKNTSTLSTYKVTYNSNTTDTVSNMPTTQTKVEGVTLKLSTSTPERAGYIFKGWATASNGSVAYGVGANYTNNNAVTLYAVWQAAYYQNIITSKIYVTLNEAITDSATNTQINVIRNATEKETATNTSGKTITLNLNNKTISFNDGYSLKNQGVMTLIGTGKITANSGITVNNTGTLNVNLDNETGYNDGTGGIIEMTSSLNADRAVQSSGTLNINSGIILNSATADKMTSTEYPYTIVCSGTVNMDGGIVRAISSDYSTQYGLHTTGTFIMNGGTIEAVGTALYTSDDGTTTISGGTIITGGINNETSRETIKHESTGNLQISGTNSIEVVSKLGSAIANYNNGNVVLSNSNAVVNGAKQAIYITSGKVTINNGVLGNDGKSLEGVDITAGTLEVNGGTIYGINQGIIITGTGNVNIKGGTVGNISNSIDGIDIVSGTLNITNGTVVGKNQGIIVTGGQVTITGGTINGYENSIDNRGGTITLGIKDTSVSTSTPTITATTLALYKESGIINFYDGIIKGATAISGTIDDLPTNYDVVTTTANSIQTATLAKKYYVKYDANGGSGTMANSTHLYGVSKALTANAFTRTGYKFLGWSTSSTATAATYTDKKSVSNLTTTAGATVTLYAVWQGNTYYIKYNPNEGTGTMENSTHIYGTTSTLTKNVFTRKGYSFKGWSISASSTTVTYADQANVTKATSTADGVYNLYAVWQGNTYYIKYNANGGTGTMANSEHTYGTTSKLTKNTFTRSGYEFKGWAVSSGGTVAYSDQGNVTRATSTAGGVYNLYAVWEQKVIDKLYYSYTVSGTASWGSTVSDKQVQLSIGNLTSGTTSAGSITVYDVPSGATVTILTNGRANSSTGGGDWYPAAKIYSNGTLIKTTSGSTTTITTTASGNLVVQFSESGVSGVTKGGAVVISAIEYNGTTLTLTQK